MLYESAEALPRLERRNQRVTQAVCAWCCFFGGGPLLVSARSSLRVRCEEQKGDCEHLTENNKATPKQQKSQLPQHRRAEDHGTRRFKHNRSMDIVEVQQKLGSMEDAQFNSSICCAGQAGSKIVLPSFVGPSRTKKRKTDPAGIAEGSPLSLLPNRPLDLEGACAAWRSCCSLLSRPNKAQNKARPGLPRISPPPTHSGRHNHVYDPAGIGMA